MSSLLVPFCVCVQKYRYDSEPSAAERFLVEAWRYYSYIVGLAPLLSCLLLALKLLGIYEMTFLGCFLPSLVITVLTSVLAFIVPFVCFAYDIGSIDTNDLVVAFVSLTAWFLFQVVPFTLSVLFAVLKLDGEIDWSWFVASGEAVE